MSERTHDEAAASDAEEEQAAAPVHDVTATTVTGSRARRSTQKFTVAVPKADDTDEFQPPVGSGQKLKDIDGVNDTVAALGKKHAETLKALYMVMYSRRFQLKNLKVIKEHILEFSGVVEQDAKARDGLFTKIARWKRPFVQEVMDVLGVDRSKKSFDDEAKPFDKDALINRLIDWLYHPQAKKSGRKASPTAKSAAKKPKAKAAEKTKAAPAKRKSTAKDASAAATKKQKTSKKTAKPVAPDDDGEDTEEEAEDSGSDYDDAPPTKKLSTKATRRGAKRVEDESDGDSGAAAGDKTPTTADALDADVKAKVKQIIEQGDAEELTVKTIVRQVSEELGRDLSAEKHAIKEFIKAGQ